MLPHAIYYDTLGSITDEASDEWKATVAGLFVLRLVDDWLDFGPQIVATDVTGLASVRRSISQISESNPSKALLKNVVDALEQGEIPAFEVIAPLLFAYAQALQYDGHFSLEEDVLLTLRGYAETAGNSEAVIRASLRLGIIYRGMGRYKHAEHYHLSASDLAYNTGDIASALRARLGYAKTTSVRGDVGRADAMCAEVAEEAIRTNTLNVLGDALHDRAHMAYLRGDYQSGVRYAYRAMEHLDTPIRRDRVLADIATGFIHLGHFEAARDTNLILTSSAQEPTVRWQATINLMFSAVLEHQEHIFELYRAALACAQLPPREEVYYRWVAGQGYRRFGNNERAEAELKQAHAIAEQYSMQQLVFELEEELKNQPTGQWEADIDSIATEIGEQLSFYTLGTV